MTVWFARPLPHDALSKEGIYSGSDFIRLPAWEVTVRIRTTLSNLSQDGLCCW